MSSADSPVSPVMAQWFAAKAQHPDALIFFRMGDFYELFFDDAIEAAQRLAIAQTRRGEHQGQPIPMAGVPVISLDGHLAKLVRQGVHVAICEQVEDPAEARKRGSKSVVRRQIVRLVTPGTLTEEALLDPHAPKALAALASLNNQIALAIGDVSTGSFTLLRLDPDQIGQELAALRPAELLVAQSMAAQCQHLIPADTALTIRPDAKSDPRFGERRLKELFEVTTLDGFGQFAPVDLAASALLVDYIELTQAGIAARLQPPSVRQASEWLAIDPATRASLEIDRTLSGRQEGSLVHTIDRTQTAPGARALRQRLAQPLLAVEAINARLADVRWFVDAPDARAKVRDVLSQVSDGARALGRIGLQRGSPRDLLALSGMVQACERIAACLRDAQTPLTSGLAEMAARFGPQLAPQTAELANAIARQIDPQASSSWRDGGFVCAGADADLDAVRALRDDTRRVIAALQAEYVEQTKVAGLRIKQNGVLGYYLEVAAKAGEPLLAAPWTDVFRHRQTLPNALRFTTATLVDLDARIARAADEARARELAIFTSLSEQVLQREADLRQLASDLAELDVAAGLAQWAQEVDAVCPLVDASSVFEAQALRHPVVEAALRQQGNGFTPNHLTLDAQGDAGPRLLIVTGPNMAGKSTYLRQAAIAVILAQAGCFVPAARFRLGVCDRVFSRVGAADDLGRGRSTFMAEMIETAAILNQSGPRALVILDEVGRGTATYDGLAIAWACVEHLHDTNRCRALFATHYHELTSLAQRLPGSANANLRAREWKGDLIFLHTVEPGAADRSYGIQVAKRAGMPMRAVKRASEVLRVLETGAGASALGIGQKITDLPLFAGAVSLEAPSTSDLAAQQADTLSALAELLDGFDPDAMSPREALDALYALKRLRQDEAQTG